MKKLLFAIAALLLSGAVISAQEETVQQDEVQKERRQLFGSTFTPPSDAKEFWSQVSPFGNLGVMITVNSESKQKSAPSPVCISPSIGAIWPNNAFISFQPRLSFYTSYYLWSQEDGCAFPAEVENRTAMALSFMLDLPAAATFRFAKCQIEAGLGLGILARIAILAPGVSSGESGSSGTAGSDKAEIQKWFWSNGRFLYPEIYAGWEYRVSEDLLVGLEARWYIPLGALISGRGLDSGIVAVSAKVIF